MIDANLEQLITAAELLRPVLEELVFVGGCVTGLLLTDEAAGAPRITLDVDAIAEITSYAEYADFGDRLRALGFAEDTSGSPPFGQSLAALTIGGEAASTGHKKRWPIVRGSACASRACGAGEVVWSVESEGAPLCRWTRRQTVLDVMPIDEKILGFSSLWYRAAMESSASIRLSEDLEIRIVTAPFFIATKIEAFKGRGDGDFLASHDLEDLVSVVDGRETLGGEVRAEREELRTYIQAEIKTLLVTEGFLDALPGYLLPDAASQSRISIVLRRLRELESIREES